MVSKDSKRKGGSGRGGERKRRGEDGSCKSKEAASTVSKNATKEGVGRRRRKNAAGSQQDKKSSSSNSDISGKAGTKNQRKRRRRRRRNRENQEKVQVQAEVSGSKGRKKKGRRKRKPKCEAQAQTERENVVCSESSGSVSHLPLSSNSSGSQPDCSNSSSFVDCNHALPMEVDNLPWANLDEPMDLSHVRLQIKGHGVDFDLQARENHQRWLSNLEKAGE